MHLFITWFLLLIFFRRFWDYQFIFAICSCDWKLHLNLTELALRATNTWSTCIGFRSEGLSGPLEILSVFKEPELHNHVMYIVSRITSFTILLKILKLPQALKSTCWIRKLIFLQKFRGFFDASVIYQHVKPRYFASN